MIKLVSLPGLVQPDADVYRVTAPVTMSSHVVKGIGTEATELCMDDMVVPTTNTTSDNATDYVTVTSWLTGKSGKVPRSVLQRTCHSNVWTLHLSTSCVTTQDNCTPHPSSLDLSSLVESLRGLSQDLGGKTAATFQIDTPTRQKRSGMATSSIFSPSYFSTNNWSLEGSLRVTKLFPGGISIFVQ